MGNHYDRQTNPRCACCMRALKWIPVLFIVAIIIWSYYAYVVQLCLMSMESLFQKIIFLLLYHFICALFFWSYWNTVLTPVGKVPPQWRIPESEVEKLFRAETQEQQKRMLEHFSRNLPVHNRTINGAIRFCEKCVIIKPDRAHHCSVCGVCVLKMDHHCPWVNNCVNFTNYKYFVLFLGYALFYCLFVALTTLPYFIKFWEGELDGGIGRFHILFLFFVAVMFAISLVSLFGYHIFLVLLNRTTLEAFRAPIFRIGGPDKNGYNLGKYANFQEVFGDNWKYWFIPVFTSRGDGVVFPMQAQHQSTAYRAMGDTPTRLDDDDEASTTDKFLENNFSINNSNASVEQTASNSNLNNISTHVNSYNTNHNNNNKNLNNIIINNSNSNAIVVENAVVTNDASFQNLDRNSLTTKGKLSPSPSPLSSVTKMHFDNEKTQDHVTIAKETNSVAWVSSSEPSSNRNDNKNSIISGSNYDKSNKNVVNV